MGLPTRRPWTEAEDAALADGRSARELAAAFGRTPGAVHARRYRLSIRAPRRWSGSEDALLRAVYSDPDRWTGAARNLAAALGRSRQAVYRRAFYLGLTRGRGPRRAES